MTQVSSNVALALLGGTVTHRQLNYWNRKLNLQLDHPNTGNGSGNRRQLTLRDVLKLRMIQIGSEASLAPNELVTQANGMSVSQLTNPHQFQTGRVYTRIDLTINPLAEAELWRWSTSSHCPDVEMEPAR